MLGWTWVSAQSRHAAGSVVVFITVFAGVQAAIMAWQGSAAELFFVHHLTARPAAALLAVAGADDAPRPQANFLVGRERTLTIEPGCDGTETLALLFAAVAALRLPWRRGLLLLVAGSAAVLVLNQCRVAVLWWALGTNLRLFDAIHSQIAPAVLLSAVGLVVLLATRDGAGASEA